MVGSLYQNETFHFFWCLVDCMKHQPGSPDVGKYPKRGHMPPSDNTEVEKYTGIIKVEE